MEDAVRVGPAIDAGLRAAALEIIRAGDIWLSHGSALQVHGLGAGPRGIWTATGPRPRRPREVPGGQLRTVVCGLSSRFGLEERSLGPGLPLLLTDPERTLADALRRPELCGGMPAIAALIVREDVRVHDARTPGGESAPTDTVHGPRRSLDLGRLVDYALRLDVGAVLRRLGFLLEMRRNVDEAAVGRLRDALTPTWTTFDPQRPRGGLHDERWRLVVNVPPAEIAAAVGLAPGLWAAAARSAAEGMVEDGALGAPGGEGETGAPGPGRRGWEPSRSPGRAPRALASLLCRFDIWRAAVLDGPLAELAGDHTREAWRCQAAGGAAGSVGADEERAAVALLVDFHYKRRPDLRELAALEAELSAILARPVLLRTMDDLVRRVARTVWGQAGVVYFRRGGGHASSARSQELSRRRREARAMEPSEEGEV